MGAAPGVGPGCTQKKCTTTSRAAGSCVEGEFAHAHFLGRVLQSRWNGEMEIGFGMPFWRFSGADAGSCGLGRRPDYERFALYGTAG
jgi:hypothetical protein